MLRGAISRSSPGGHCLPGAGPLTKKGGAATGSCDRHNCLLGEVSVCLFDRRSKPKPCKGVPGSMASRTWRDPCGVAKLKGGDVFSLFFMQHVHTNIRTPYQVFFPGGRNEAGNDYKNLPNCLWNAEPVFHSQMPECTHIRI